MLKSQTIRRKDFSSKWYKKWSKVLKQEKGIAPNQPIHNKAWQNAIILQAIAERDLLNEGKKALGFGVGIERVPSALASMGVLVTASDQDYETGKASWANGQLSKSIEELNKYGISDKKTFLKNTTFKRYDMNKIPAETRGKYDIVWSNCALGHLGSIPNGLKFIEESLKCLKPGGVAVHTTEMNVLSDDKTLDSGGTVIFRRSDLAGLFDKLHQRGYECAPLSFNFGNKAADKEVSFPPYTAPELLKIHVGGHVLSQIVLIISKPKAPAKPQASHQRLIGNKRNDKSAERYLKKNKRLAKYISNHKTATTQGLEPVKRKLNLTMKAGSNRSVRVEFRNTGKQTFYDSGHYYHEGYPLVVVTGKLLNRKSKFATKEWATQNRPAIYFKGQEGSSKWGSLAPGTTFYTDITLKAPAKPGKYDENFELALEGLGVMEGTHLTVSITVK